jgi:hypothetical protein
MDSDEEIICIMQHLQEMDVWAEIMDRHIMGHGSRYFNMQLSKTVALIFLF